MRASTRPVELTLSTAGVFDQMSGLAAEFGDAVIGLGTVTTGTQTETAIENGAKFIVSPTAELDVIRVAAGAPAVSIGGRCWEMRSRAAISSR